MSQVRTRFAPSPTGYLHIGGARTALFAWLYARKMGGQFILRVEDTDLARSTQASVDGLLRDMRWLGLTWDEGPYFQSQRLDIYEKYLEQLKLKGLAYPTFESKEEVEAEREAAIAAGHVPGGDFDEATPEQVAKMALEGKKPAWRFRIPESGNTEFPDLVHGAMRFENRLMSDFVIVRSDGMPTYNFAATLDDALMGITHVIRGDDHLSNTPRQVCLYRALGLPEPAFAHIPMILGPDKQRLSKRHGATAVGEYEKMGFLPEAMLNYLALLGWSLDDKTTLISVKDLITNFSLERVTKHAAVFDHVKLGWMNGQYLIESDPKRLGPLLKKACVTVAPAAVSKDDAWFERLALATREKARTLGETAFDCGFFFGPLEAVPEARARFHQAGGPVLALQLAAWLDTAHDDAAQLEASLRAWCESKTVKFKDAVGVLRNGLSGRLITPGIFDTILLLGRAESSARLTAAAAWAV